jgi:AcrR family transcriptional regulator
MAVKRELPRTRTLRAEVPRPVIVQRSASTGGAPSRGLAKALAGDEARIVALRDRRRREYEALLEAAHRVLLRRGYEQTRVEDIMREAGISTRAFYRFCSGKDDLFLELFNRSNVAAMQRLRATLASRSRASEQLDSFIDATLDLAYKDRLRPEVRLFLSVPNELTARYAREVMACRAEQVLVLQEIIASGRESGEFPAAEPEDDAWAIFGALGATLNRIVLADDPPPRQRVGRRLRRFCQAALTRE